MTILAGIKRQIVSFAVGRASRKMLASGQVKLAPTYGLLEVRPNQIGIFELQIASISSVFDKILVLWPNENLPTQVPKNTKLFAASESLSNRWQLINHCNDGFVFPISLVKPIQPDHVNHLKRHLFSIGGANAVGLLCLEAGSAHETGDNHHGADLVPVPVIDPEYAIIDQRYWKLSGDQFVGESGGIVLAQEARDRGFGLFACNHALSNSKFSKKIETPLSRENLIESTLRNPRVLRAATDESLRMWVQVWNRLGLNTEVCSSLEFETTLTKALEKNQNLNQNIQSHVKSLLGKKRKIRGRKVD